MPRISANLGFLWIDLPLVERIRQAAAAGFSAVEFHFPYDVPAGEVRAMLHAVGLPAVGLNTRPGDPTVREMGLAALPGREADARAAIDEAIAYATAIDAGYVHVMAGNPPREGNDRAKDAFLGALAYASDKAEGAGLTIVIEPLNAFDAPDYFLRSTGQAKELIDLLGKGNVKIMFDCYHAQISGGDLTRRLQTLLPIVGHIQIAAVPTRHEPDEGEVAYDRLLKAIDGMGWEGFVGAEYRPRGSVEEGLTWLRSL